MEVGMAMRMLKVEPHEPRKNKQTTAVRMAESHKVNSISSTVSSINLVESQLTWSL